MRYSLTYSPGIVSDDTLLARGGRYIDADKVRFVRADAGQPYLPQLIGGWERLVRTMLTGVCRTVFCWTDNAGRLNVAFGTHSKLMVWRGGALFDITPYGKPQRLPPAPLTVSNGSPTVTVNHPAHGFSTGLAIKVYGAKSVGRIVPSGGPYTITVSDANTYHFTFTSNASVARTLGSNPLAVIIGGPTVTVTDTAHGLETGDSVTISGSSAIGGITPNGTFTVLVIDENTYSYDFTSNATSTVAAGGGAAVVATLAVPGGGDNVVICPQTELPAGQINGTGTAGYSTGAYSVGGYGQPSEDDFFPRTWSFGTLGEALVASPRDGAVYLWENDTSARAELIGEAPIRCASIMTTPERVIMALGTEEEASHAYNPRCIRHSDSRIVIDDGTEGFRVWYTDATTLAREKILEGAGRIVAGRGAGSGSFVWTDNEVFEASYVGALDEIYHFERLAEDAGLIGPNAACVRNQQAYWLTPDLQFMTAMPGNEPVALECPHRAELRANLTPAQRDKIVASTLTSFGECWFFYPDRRDGLENSRALFFHTQAQWWSKAQLARTAFADAGPADYPAGVDVSGNCYWHERGKSADGNRISWFLEAGPQYVNDTQSAVFLRTFLPDFKDQQGSINLTLYTRERPQSEPETLGPYVMTPEDEAIDLHCDGTLISWRMDGNSGPADFRLGNPIVEAKSGRRAK